MQTLQDCIIFLAVHRHSVCPETFDCLTTTVGHFFTYEKYDYIHSSSNIKCLVGLHRNCLCRLVIVLCHGITSLIPRRVRGLFRFCHYKEQMLESHLWKLGSLATTIIELRDVTVEVHWRVEVGNC